MQDLKMFARCSSTYFQNDEESVAYSSYAQT